MEEFLLQVLNETAVGVALIMALTFLARSITKHFLSKDIEKFKGGLQSSSERAISDYKAGIDKERVRLQISYGGIFKKQAETIIELYRLIASLRLAIERLIADGDSAEENFHERWKELYLFTQHNSILYPESLDAPLKQLCLDSINGFYDYQRESSPKNAQSLVKSLTEIEGTLKRELRRLIGVQEAK